MSLSDGDCYHVNFIHNFPLRTRFLFYDYTRFFFTIFILSLLLLRIILGQNPSQLAYNDTPTLKCSYLFSWYIISSQLKRKCCRQVHVFCWNSHLTFIVYTNYGQRPSGARARVCVCVSVCIYVCLTTYIFVCVYVCMYVWLCVCVCMTTYIFVCVYVCMYDYVYLCVCVCMYNFVYFCVCVCMYDYVYLCVCVCLCMTTYICVCVYAHTFLCIFFVYACM